MKKFIVFIILIFTFSLNFASNRIEWTAVANANSYKVIIEDLNGEIILEEETKSNFLDLILLPGKYRYQIVVFNKLLKEASRTTWIELEVLFDKQPIILFSEAEIYYVRENLIEFILSIYDLDEDGKVYIQKDRYYSEAEIVSSIDYEYLCRFNTKGFKDGKYDIVVENPSGKSAKLKDGLEFIRKKHPYVSKVNPKQVYEHEITPLFTVRGNKFEEGARVEITGRNGSVEVSNINVVSKKELNFWADFKDANKGYYRVKIINPSGKNASKFLFKVLATKRKQWDAERNISSSVNLLFRWPYFTLALPIASIDYSENMSFVTSGGFLVETDFGGDVPLFRRLGYAFSLEYHTTRVAEFFGYEITTNNNLRTLFLGHELYFNTKFISPVNFHLRAGGGVFLLWEKYKLDKTEFLLTDTGGFLAFSGGLSIAPTKNLLIRPLAVIKPLLSPNGGTFQTSMLIDIGYRF